MNNQKQIVEIIDLWKTNKKQYVKKSSFSAYTLLIENHLLPVFGKNYTIEETEVQAFVFQKLNSGLSQKTIKDILIVLKMIMKFGAKHKWLVYTPFDIQFPTEREKYTVEVLSRTDQKKIMNHIQEHFTFRNLGVYICLSSGMRIGEVCALTWEDIDTDSGIIKVNRTIQRIYVIENGIRKTELILDTPKTKNSIREIPINKDLLRILKPFKKIVNSSFYVLTNDAKPTEPRTYRTYYKNLMKELNMPALKFHGLRHSFATRCIESNCDYKTVSVLLGHSNISTTLNLYVHPNMEQKKKAIEQMFKGLK
ncbi:MULTISPECIES: site-specific integrase [unclassified Sphingobacterium]|uniref:tyrosine-type recombinase/integrase n=1 Tax=unclassified Sphingobacterium TaxID=2609468 RepID=UPI00105134A1|nr:MULTISPECIES: site-specific integrase [unclassified Sphingobacterium]MCS3557257.1 integrase [Sphingobacterium sp. JUb21]TCQ96829.1 site-specific recombinase XerD [Sphingobacterium sp. JUb20]